MEFIRALPERVPALEAAGWIVVATSTFSHGHGVEVVLKRSLRDDRAAGEDGHEAETSGFWERR